MVRLYWINVGGIIKVSSINKSFFGKLAVVVTIVGKGLFDIFIYIYVVTIL